MTRRCLLLALLTFALTATAQFGGIDRAKGFKLPDYYSSPNGVQKLKSLLTGMEGGFVTNDVIFLINPRIEHYGEDGSLIGVATAMDALVNLRTRTASGTNMISFRNGNTNLFHAGRGFFWQQSNSFLIVSNQSYTWINRAALTNLPSKK